MRLLAYTHYLQWAAFGAQLFGRTLAVKCLVRCHGLRKARVEGIRRLKLLWSTDQATPLIVSRVWHTVAVSMRKSFFLGWRVCNKVQTFALSGWQPQQHIINFWFANWSLGLPDSSDLHVESMSRKVAFRNWDMADILLREAILHSWDVPKHLSSSNCGWSLKKLKTHTFSRSNFFAKSPHHRRVSQVWLC